jgi:ADP-heptose:LPS heptosyltransferase
MSISGKNDSDSCKAALHSPLKNGYLIQNPVANWVVKSIDRILRFWMRGEERNFSIPPPKKILLSNLGQLGDVVLMSSLFPVLKEALADVKLGVVVGSWAEKMVRDHPLIDHVHVVDHWKIARSQGSFWEKFQKTARMSRAARKEMIRVGYDVAIECNFHFPNTISLAYRAKIPVRLGYTSGGFAPLLTHALSWTVKEQSVAMYALALIQRFLVLNKVDLKPSLPAVQPLTQPLPSDYVVIHMGSGHPMKEWPLSKWKELCKALHQEGHFLVFTGKGDKEGQNIAEVMAELDCCINLCNRLSWEECISLVKGAQLLVSVDTGLAHVAAGTDTSAVLIYTGIHPKNLWWPLGNKTTVLVHSVSCSPCHLSQGCREMACIREVSVQEVYQACVDCGKLNKKYNP